MFNFWETNAHSEGRCGIWNWRELKINSLGDTYIAKSARYYAVALNGKSDARWKGRKERHDFAFRVVFAVWNTCVSGCARGSGRGDVIEGCCAFESRRLCWMCGGASINSYWFRCRLRTPPPRLPFLLVRDGAPAVSAASDNINRLRIAPGRTPGGCGYSRRWYASTSAWEYRTRNYVSSENFILTPWRVFW